MSKRWKYVEWEDRLMRPVIVCDGIVLFVFNNNPNPKHAELAAAAPKLLEALERVLKVPRGSSGRIILEQEDEAEIRTAIAKAKGEQQ